jgi:hypothetical protein
MRGQDRISGALFSYVDVEARIPAKHPLRTMRRLTHAALDELNARFSVLYEAVGRPSIPPERLLRAALLQLLYSIRSERQQVERIEFDLLFRWSSAPSAGSKAPRPRTGRRGTLRLEDPQAFTGVVSGRTTLTSPTSRAWRTASTS